MSEIFLLPGEFYFGKDYKTVKTLLGSCVAITMWNERLKVGGMCHFKLPERRNKNSVKLDGNYGDEALLLFMGELRKFNLKPVEMKVGVFGAGNMFADIVKEDGNSIGMQNVKLALRCLSKYGFKISHESFGGEISRKIAFDIESGAVKVASLDVRRQKWL